MPNNMIANEDIKLYGGIISLWRSNHQIFCELQIIRLQYFYDMHRKEGETSEVIFISPSLLAKLYEC